MAKRGLSLRTNHGASESQTGQQSQGEDSGGLAVTRVRNSGLLLLVRHDICCPHGRNRSAYAFADPLHVSSPFSFCRLVPSWVGQVPRIDGRCLSPFPGKAAGGRRSFGSEIPL